MNRKNFISKCCYTAIGVPLVVSMLQGCESLHYAGIVMKDGVLLISKSEFDNNGKQRRFVIVNTDSVNFPICIYRTGMDKYIASLMECTHRSCELNVGGGMYSCPCHGSEFSIEGEVLQGPASEKLRTFKITLDDENIYISL